MIKRLIFFLVRRKLGLKKGESFRFANQVSPYNYYAIYEDGVWKYEPTGNDAIYCKLSNVNLNYLLSDKCEVVKVKWE